MKIWWRLRRSPIYAIYLARTRPSHMMLCDVTWRQWSSCDEGFPHNSRGCGANSRAFSWKYAPSELIPAKLNHAKWSLTLISTNIHGWWTQPLTVHTLGPTGWLVSPNVLYVHTIDSLLTSLGGAQQNAAGGCEWWTHLLMTFLWDFVCRKSNHNHTSSLHHHQGDEATHTSS